MAELFLGVDWGTHSSKWACSFSAGGKYFKSMPMFSSDILPTSDSLTFSPTHKRFDEEEIVRGLKQVLIENPRSAYFWRSERPDTGTSLGEAIAFSLCCLLGDATNELGIRTGSKSFPEMEIGFSFPNWLVNRNRDFRVAARNFQEAVVVAIEILCSVANQKLPLPGKPFSKQAWKEMVETKRESAISRLANELDIETIAGYSFPAAEGQIIVRFLTESGAAGLPYLRAMNIEEIPGAPGLAKLLVIDVGAGSTDVGYMLRVRNRKTNAENLYFFPPADSYPIAGNELTHRIRRHFQAKGQPLTYAEAETRKIQQTSWAQLSFVKLWIERMCDHILEYVEGIQDSRWLVLPVSLNVVVTGGSGLVPGLKEEIGKAIRSALSSRRDCDSGVVNRVVLPGEHIPQLRFRTEAEYARRAVCIGVADQSKPGIRFVASMDPPERQRYVQGPRWV